MDGKKTNIEMDISHLRRRCPKCGGNLFLYNDYYGWYEQCLQCSLILYLDIVYKDSSEMDSTKTSEISQGTTPECQ
jgi:uncharacterized protein (DUF983 family)